MALAADMGYGFMPNEQAYASTAPATRHPWSPSLTNFSDPRYGYDGNDSEPDTMPPPCVYTPPPTKNLTLTVLGSYTEHEPKPPKSLPQMQTSRRGPLKQAAKRGSYAYLGGGPALSTYRPNMAPYPGSPTPRVSTPQKLASRGGGDRASTPKPPPSRTPTPRRQSSPTKPSSALSNPAQASDKKPAMKKCSQCQTPGHDTRDCPLNRYGLGKSSAGPSQGLSHQQGYREMSETTTTTAKTTAKHSKSSSVLDGRISKPKATQKKKGTGKK